jgi:hypothetical protein
MKKLQSFLSGIPNDKLLHFFYGTLIGAPLVAFTNPLVAFFGISIIAIGKELYDDLSGTGTIDVYDTVFTVIPTALILIAKYI